MTQDEVGGVWLLEINAPPSLGLCHLPLSDDDSAQAAAGKPLPDWGRALTVQMMGDLIRRFVLPHMGAAAEPCAEDCGWSEVAVTPTPLHDHTAAAASASASASSGSGNAEAWARFKRGLAREVCEEQAKEDEGVEAAKRRRVGSEAVAALFAKRVQFVPGAE